MRAKAVRGMICRSWDVVLLPLADLRPSFEQDDGRIAPLPAPGSLLGLVRTSVSPLVTDRSPKAAVPNGKAG